MVLEENAIETLLSECSPPAEDSDMFSVEENSTEARDGTDHIASSLLSAAIEQQNKAVKELSPEDIAWADAYLKIGPDTSEDEWSAMKEALLELARAECSPPSEDPDVFSVEENRTEARDETDSIISSLLSAAIEQQNKAAEELSPEDGAWADSCLTIGPDTSEDEWSAMKEALLEALLQPMESEPQHHIGDEEEAPVGVGSTSDSVSSDPMPSSSTDDDGSFSLVGEPSQDDIFKVWDLESLVDEDELKEIQLGG